MSDPVSMQVSMSMAKTRFRRCAQVMGATGLARSTVSRGRCGTMRFRCLKYGAKIPWKRVRFKCGRGTKAAKRAMKSSGEVCEAYFSPEELDQYRAQCI